MTKNNELKELKFRIAMIEKFIDMNFDYGYSNRINDFLKEKKQ